MNFWTILFGLAQLVTILVAGAGFFFAMRYDIRELRHELIRQNQRLSDTNEVVKVLDRRIHEETDETRREVGETAAAIREKIKEVELFIRDTFVRKETFGPVMLRIENDVKSVGDRIETRLLRMEAKIDTKT